MGIERVVHRGITYTRNLSTQGHGAPYFMHDFRPLEREGLLHRVIWEEHYGPIPDGVVIHHIDGDTGNNEIVNLEAHSQSSHMKGHHARAKFEGIEKRCERCGAVFRDSSRGQHGRFCSDGCQVSAAGFRRRASGVDKEERVCIVCGNTFMVRKWTATKTCSSRCAGVSRSKAFSSLP